METEVVIGFDMTRLFRLIEVEEKGSVTAFAKKIGSAPTKVYNWQKYGILPSVSTLTDILNAYPGYPSGYYFVENEVKNVSGGK